MIVVDYIGGKHDVPRKAQIARRKGGNDAIIAQARFRKVHPEGEVHMNLLAFIESPSVPDKITACTRWPSPRFQAGQIKLGMFFLVMGEGDTADEAVDDALKRHPKPGLF